VGNHYLRVAPHNIYPAAGGEWLALACDDGAAWAALRAYANESELARLGSTPRSTSAWRRRGRTLPSKARPQWRTHSSPTWASTGVKNPDYHDTLYVSGLIASDTVNTMPEKTLKAYADHGTPGQPIRQSYDEAAQVMKSVADAITCEPRLPLSASILIVTSALTGPSMPWIAQIRGGSNCVISEVARCSELLMRRVTTHLDPTPGRPIPTRCPLTIPGCHSLNREKSEAYSNTSLGVLEILISATIEIMLVTTYL
jgi:Transaldolase/Fructose-6-phosphate aldolase